MFIGDTYSCSLVTENYLGADTVQNAGKRSDITENRTVIRMRVLIIQEYEGLLKPEGNTFAHWKTKSWNLKESGFFSHNMPEEGKTQANCLRYAVVVQVEHPT